MTETRRRGLLPLVGFILAHLLAFSTFASGEGSPGAMEVPPPEEDGFFGFRAEMEERGARITYVFDDAPAEEAGLRPGDLILTLDGTELAGFTHDQLHELVLPFRVGERVSLEVLRDDRVLPTTITLVPTPPAHRTSREARERFHEALRENEAIEQLDRLLDRSSVLWVRPAQDDEGYLIRPGDGPWESLHPSLYHQLDRHLEGSVSELGPSQVLRIRVAQEESGTRLLDLKVLEAERESE